MDRPRQAAKKTITTIRDRVYIDSNSIGPLMSIISNKNVEIPLVQCGVVYCQKRREKITNGEWVSSTKVESHWNSLF